MTARRWKHLPWKQAALWLGFLAPFFYLSYGFANHLAAQRGDVGAVVFDWEHGVPFLAWTIVPYWSINLFYGLSLFLCRTRDEVHAHGRRLLTAQLVAVSCFLLFPLGFTFARPDSDGILGLFFAALTSFDKPFNQAPSLHIALLVILWDLYRRLIPRSWHWLLHGWSLAIAVSVLTTYQHHFIDLPTGALLGACCLWLWPLDAPGPLRSARITGDPKRRRLALLYAIGAAASFGTAALGGIALWLCWPGTALVMVALGCAAIVLFGCMLQSWRGDGVAIVLLVLALSPVERYLALRLRFDAGLFADLADGRIADLAALDAGLATLGVRRTPPRPRSLADRLAGSRRLWRFHAIIVALMAVGTGLAVVFA